MHPPNFSFTQGQLSGINVCSNDPTQVLIHTAYTACVALLFSMFTFKWILRRSYFPIRERSPFLTLFFVTSGLLNMLAYPVATIYCYLSKCDVQSNLSNRTFANIIAAFQIFAFIPYFFRQIRIYVVFRMKLDNKLLMFTNRGERVWILLTLIIIAAMISWAVNMQPGKDISNLWIYYLNEKSGTQSIIAPIVFNIESCGLILFAFLLRKIPQEYNFSRELVTIFIVNLIFSNALEIVAFSSFSDSLRCMGPLPLFHVLINLKFLIIFFVTVIKPIMLALPDHLNLSPLLVLEGELNFVLKDEKCFVPFYKFTEYKENTEARLVGSSMSSAKNNKLPLFPLSLLYFVMRVTLIEKHEKLRADAIRRLVHDCIINSDKDLFSMKIKNQLAALYSNPTYEFKIEDIAEAYTQAYIALNDLYLTEYRFTNSFYFLRRTLEENEEICKRLNIYKMI